MTSSWDGNHGQVGSLGSPGEMFTCLSSRIALMRVTPRSYQPSLLLIMRLLLLGSSASHTNINI